MAAAKTPETRALSTEELAAQWQDLAEQSQRVVDAFLEKQKDREDYSIFDTAAIGRAFMELYSNMLADPKKLAEAQASLFYQSMALWKNTLDRMAGKVSEPLIRSETGDRRFKDKAWEEDLVFNYLKQSYLLTSKWMQSLVNDVDGLDPKNRERVDFYTRQFISSLAPSNFALTNPAVIRKAKETGGQNLLDGLKNMLRDMERGKGEIKISMTKMDAFELGKNVAASSGKVVFQNELMQLLQYQPSTEQVYKRPLLIVPPWINKFYILDLQPKNSFIKFAVDQGYTVFVISWVNPTKALAQKQFSDYLLEGPLAALDAIELATGENEINLIGFCIGGILSEALLAYLQAKDDTRVKSATFFTTLLDFQEVGEVSVFVDDDMVRNLQQHIEKKGYLEGKHMAKMFNMMRENDLIWSFVVNNYLMGREPVPFDLLYWNADSTRLPASMLMYYLKNIYLDNGLIKPGYLELDGVPIDVGTVETPIYSIAAKDDHIAPWKSCYPVTQKFAGPIRFVLGASGHIAGIVNPPAANKYCYWTNESYPEDPQEWLDHAREHAGSWWTDWHRWQLRKSGRKVPARMPGEGELPAIEDAPGAYVRVRAPD